MNEALAEDRSQEERGATLLRGRTLTFVGAGILVGLMLLGAFSIGVWVGSGRDDPAAVGAFGGGRFGGPGGGNAGAGGGFGPGGGNAGPGGGFGPAGQAGFNGAGAGLSETPDVFGVVQSLRGETIVVGSARAPVVVTLLDDTEVSRSGGDTATVGDLEEGDLVAVYGGPSEDGRTFRAERVVILDETR